MQIHAMQIHLSRVLKCVHVMLFRMVCHLLLSCESHDEQAKDGDEAGCSNQLPLDVGCTLPPDRRCSPYDAPDDWIYGIGAFIRSSDAEMVSEAYLDATRKALDEGERRALAENLHMCAAAEPAATTTTQVQPRFLWA